MSRIIRIDAEVEQIVLNNQGKGETKQATLGRLVRHALERCKARVWDGPKSLESAPVPEPRED